MQNFEYFYGLNICILILQHLDNLSATLQNPQLSAMDGQELMKNVVETLRSLRTSQMLSLHFQKVKDRAKKNDENQF